MRPVDLIRLVWTNLRRARFRAALSASGVVIGTAAVVILISLASGVQAFATKDLASIGPLNEINVISLAGDGGGGGGMIFIRGVSNSEVSKLTPRYLQALAGRDDVAAIMPRQRLFIQSSLKYKQFVSGASIAGVDARALADINPPLASGDLAPGRWEVVIGAKVGESFTDPRRTNNVRVEAIDLQGKTLTLTLTRQTAEGAMKRTVRLRVAGVLAPRGGDYDYGVYIRMADYDELRMWETGKRPNRAKDGYSEAVVLARSADDVEAITQQLQDDGFIAFSSQQILGQINRFFGILQAFVGAVGAVTLAIAGTGIANTMITAIYERTREIGLMKALGATDEQVMGVFLAEAAAIGGLGGVGGLSLGWLFSQAINLLAQQFYLPQLAAQGGSALSGDLIVTPAWVFVVIPMFAMGMGVLAGIYPARRAAMLDPVVALRAE
jgi:putative ABC transport system permease protein